MKYYRKKNCRLCNSINLEKKLSLTPTPAADSYVAQKDIKKNQDLIPLELMMCKDCKHTQLSCVIDAEEVYLNYIYETASTLGLSSHFFDCAKYIIENYAIKKNGLVLDIGSNDGILLKYFKDQNFKVLGIDPMPGISIKAKENGVDTVEGFFNKDLAEKLKNKHEIPAIISCNNLVADTDNLEELFDDIKILMNKETIFFFETFYFYSQVKNNNWDFTYHEHYSYFTIKPLKKFIESKNMEIIDVIENNTKGGSIRVVTQLKGGKNKVSESVDRFLFKEEQNKFHSSEIFNLYEKNINAQKENNLNFLESLKNSNQTVVGYGASATSTTLIYHYNLNLYLDYLVDDFKSKQNLFSPGYHIPVFSPDKIYTNEKKIDYVMILAWRYKDKIIKKNQKFLDKGGKFIIPLPKFEIVSK